MATDPIHYLIGRAFGDRALVWLRRQLGEQNRFLAWVERSFRRAGGLMVFAMPGAPVCLMAGITRIRARRFFALNLLGTVTIVLLLRGLASVLKGPLEAVLNFNDRYVAILTPLFFGLMIVQVVRTRRKRTGQVPVCRRSGHDGARSVTVAPFRSEPGATASVR